MASAYSGMRFGPVNPIAESGVVEGKAFADQNTIDLFSECAARNGQPGIRCYPNRGGLADHDILTGFLSFGIRETQNPYALDGQPNEYGICSVSGMNMLEYCSHFDARNRFYFQGVVTSDYHLSNQLGLPTPDPETGYGFMRAGTKTIINNGPEMFYPGDLIATDLPRLEEAERQDGRNPTARMGISPGQYRFIVKPFRASDITTEMEGAFAAMRATKSERGIQDMDISALLPIISGSQDVPHLPCQTMAAALQFGWVGIGLVFLEVVKQLGIEDQTPQQIVTRLKLFSREEKPELLAFIAAVMQKHVGPWAFDRAEDARQFLNDKFGVNFNSASYLSSNDDDKTKLQALIRNLPEILHTGIFSVWLSMSSQIIGSAIGASRPGEALHAKIQYVSI